jgi:transposase
VKPFLKGQKNDYNDAEAIAEAALRPNLRTVREKSQDQLDLQPCHRVRSRLISRLTATINQIRAFLIEQGIAVRAGLRSLRSSLLEILVGREDEMSPRMNDQIMGLREDWLQLDERIETLSLEIEKIGHDETNCQRLMTVPGVGPIISTAVVAAVGTGEAFERGRDFGAWLGLVPRQSSTGGRSIRGGISKRGSKYLRTLFIRKRIGIAFDFRRAFQHSPRRGRSTLFGAAAHAAGPRASRTKRTVLCRSCFPRRI